MNLAQLSETLKKYIPLGAEVYCAELLFEHKVHLNIKNPRLSKLGDYRPKHANIPHRISINKDLNPYGFLITFIHEIAHLTNWEKYQNRVAPHGPEWKQEFKELILPLLNSTIFPLDIYKALVSYMQNPAASSCSDPNLMRILSKYDADNGWVLLDDVPLNSKFKLKNGTEFLKVAKNRTRYKCIELKTSRMFLVPGVSPCKLLS